MSTRAESVNNRYLVEHFGEKNFLAFSDLAFAEMDNVFKTFSIKYVYKGLEYYKLESGEFKVRANEILYAVNQPGKVYFHNCANSNSIGLCIGLHEQTLLETLRVHSNGCFNSDPESSLRSFSEFPSFLEGLHEQQTKKISRYLFHLCKRLDEGVPINKVVHQEWFLQLSTEIVQEEFPRYRCFNNLRGKK